MRAFALVGLLIAVSGCASLKTPSASPGAAPTSAAPAPVPPPPVAPPPVPPPPVPPPPVPPPPVPPPPVPPPPVAPPPVAPPAAPPSAVPPPTKSSVAARPPKQSGTVAQTSASRPPTAARRLGRCTGGRCTGGRCTGGRGSHAQSGRFGAAAARDPRNRRIHQAVVKKSGGRLAQGVPDTISRPGQAPIRRIAAALRWAAAQGALTASGRGPAPGGRHRILAGGNLGHSRGP